MTTIAVAAPLAGTGAAADTPPAAAPPEAAALTDRRPCPDQPGFTCAWLVTPRDHAHPARGSIRLRVAFSDNAKAPKGVLLFFPGGPGLVGVPYISRLAARMPEVAREYRIVTADQRGTGESGAVDCPRLQAEVGSSDIARASRRAVAECARVVGGMRDYFSTDQTLADFDLLRRALGAGRVAVDGASYGSFAAARYATDYPHRVSRVVLDSVLPHASDPAVPLYLAGLRAQARVLRTACRALPDCAGDPAADLAWLVRHGYDGVALFDLIVGYGFVDRDYAAVVRALRAARDGRRADLDALLAGVPEGNAAPYQVYSAGLHIATACADGRYPWGDSATPRPLRLRALDRAVRALSEKDVWPYTPRTAGRQGYVRNCVDWPEARPGRANHRRLPDVPTLLLAGDRDLSTPVEWAYQEAAQAPDSKVVVVKGANHSLQLFEIGTEGRRAVTDFLLR